MSGSAAGEILRTGQVYDLVAVDDVPMIAGTTPEIELADDGRISGRATVNRLMGGWSRDDGALRLTGLATTMMAGPPEHMEQEARVLRALTGLLAVAAGESDDEVVLTSADGGVVVLRARPAEIDVPS